MGALGSKASKSSPLEEILRAALAIFGETLLTPEVLSRNLQVVVPVAASLEEALDIEKAALPYHSLMIKNLESGNFLFLSRRITELVTSLREGHFDPIAPSKSLLVKLNELKTAIFAFRVWTKSVFDSSGVDSSSVLARMFHLSPALLQGEEEEDIVENDVFFGSSRQSSVASFQADPDGSLDVVGGDLSLLSTVPAAPRPADASLPQFMAALACIVQLRLVPCTRGVITEAARLLLLLLSCDIRGEGDNPCVTTLAPSRTATQALIQALCSLVCAPAPPPDPREAGGSLVSDFLHAFSSLSSLVSGPPDPAPTSRPLLLSSETSLLLLALIYSRCASKINRFLAALAICADSADPQSAPGAPRFSFAAMFSWLCASIHTHPAVVLLYSLMYNNTAFFGHVVSRTSDAEMLLLPLLQRVAATTACDNHELYTILVTLLMLSQDTHYVEAMFATPLGRPLEWYGDRTLRDTSAGDVWTVVLVRLLQLNMTSARDKFVNDMGLASLSNMAAHMVHLSAFTSQRLVVLLVLLTKHYLRLLKRTDAETPGAHGAHVRAADSNPAPAPASPPTPKPVTPEADASRTTPTRPESESDGVPPDSVPGQRAVVAAVLRRLLAVAATVVAVRLRANTDLVYCILLERDAFVALRTHDEFREETATLLELVAMVDARLDAPHGARPAASVEDTMALLSAVTRQLPDNKLRRPPLERFEYEQTLEPEEFFAPGVWAAALALSPLLHSHNLPDWQ
jgi:hypothetical protein